MDNDYTRSARLLTREEFVVRFQGVFVVFSLDPRDAPVGGFETAVRGAKEPAKLDPKRLQVQRIEKALGNPYADRISVGRTANCDVVIHDASVSKLHAHFLRDGQGRLVVVDHHSANGTVVNGIAALPGVNEVVEPGDLVQFGQIRTTILTAGGVYDALQRAL